MFVSESAFADGVQELTRFVIRQAEAAACSAGFGYRGSECAPSTFLELQREFRLCSLSGLPMRVSALHAESSIFTQKVNLAFRFWHDRTHLTQCAEFDRGGEAVVSQEQLRQLELMGYKPASLVWRLLFCETLGQTECAHLTGAFPTDQRLFTNEFLNLGLPAAIERESERQTDRRDLSNVYRIALRPRQDTGGGDAA